MVKLGRLLVPALAALMAGAILLAACAPAEKATPAPGVTPAVGKIVIETGEEGGRAFTRPAKTEIPAGQEITVEFRNIGAAIHDLVIQGTKFRSKQVVEGGKTDTFKIKIDKPGTYKLTCEYHHEAVADLVVK